MKYILTKKISEITKFCYVNFVIKIKQMLLANQSANDNGEVFS